MHTTATTVQEYISQLSPDHQRDIKKLRSVIRKYLPKGYQEYFDYGMITYAIPLSRFPHTYNKRPLMVAALAAQKNYIALHLVAVYGNPALRKTFEKAYKATGKKLNMGKACLRLTTAADAPLEVIADIIARVTPEQYIAFYEATRLKKR